MLPFSVILIVGDHTLTSKFHLFMKMVALMLQAHPIGDNH